MSPDRERWYRILFWAAAVYDLTLGIVFLFFYRPVFEGLGIEDTLPEHTSFLSLIAAFLFIAAWEVATGAIQRLRDGAWWRAPLASKSRKYRRTR